jgi:hypothetical protein
MMGEPKDPENLHEIAERDIAVARLEILVGRAGEVRPAGHFRLRPVSLQAVLSQPLAKDAHGVGTILDVFTRRQRIASHCLF